MDELVAAARRVREHAYCPYSGYRVGAALRAEDGNIYVGANVENVSYGATICAERAAVLAMASSGLRQFLELALVTADGGTPCGACLQVLSEFTRDAKVILATDEEIVGVTTVEALMPRAFRSDEVKRT